MTTTTPQTQTQTQPQPQPYTCEQMGVCRGTNCPTCPHTALAQWYQEHERTIQAQAQRRESDAENLAQWEQGLLAQAEAELDDFEERQRVLQVLGPPKTKPAGHHTQPDDVHEPSTSDHLQFLSELTASAKRLAMGVAVGGTVLLIILALAISAA